MNPGPEQDQRRLRSAVRRRREQLRGLHINRMIPNILTLLALCAGMTAIKFSLDAKWEPALLAVVVAAVLDGLDGRVARILKGASKFGAELDSLSDFICFGVAPAVMLYLWAMRDAGRFGWVLVLLYAIACALRLARFNTALDEPDLPGWTRNFFSGVPSPAGAGLVLFPMILSLQIGDELVRRPEVVGVFLVVVGGLMVSRAPTYSFKKVRVPHHWILPTMLIIAAFAASAVTAPWATLSGILALYLISMPFSFRAHRRLSRGAPDAS